MGKMWNQSSYSRKLPLRSRQNDVPHFIYEITLSLPCLLLERDSFKYRDMFCDDFPDCQINNWDCGYYQLKMLWKEYMPKELAKFRALYSKLADKMRPMMYELGFISS